MLKSELYTLENIVGELVNYNENAVNDDRPEFYDGLAKRVGIVCKQLKAQLRQQFFSSIKDSIFNRYIRYHQSSLISLSDQLSLKFSSGNGSGSFIESQSGILILPLEELLEFLETSFYKYFDKDHIVSIEHFRTESKPLNTKLSLVVGQLRDIQVDEQLITAFNGAIAGKLKDGRYFKVSYRELDYLNGLLNFVSDHIASEFSDTALFADILYQHNFNSQNYQRWYVDEISTAISHAPKKNRNALLNKERDRLAALTMSTQVAYDPNKPAINDLLRNWLQIQLNGNPDQITLNVRVSGPERIPLNFSVSQFALLVRLSYLEGAYHLHNISEILRFFAFRFESKKQLHVSVKSFTRAFYGTDQKTAAAVRDFLQRMLELLEKTYFPRT